MLKRIFSASVGLLTLSFTPIVVAQPQLGIPTPTLHRPILQGQPIFPSGTPCGQGIVNGQSVVVVPAPHQICQNGVLQVKPPSNSNPALQTCSSQSPLYPDCQKK
jgi:hypothetical protein